MKKTNRLWTSQELAYLRQAWEKGTPYKTMAARLQRTEHSIANAISQKIKHGKIVAANLPVATQPATNKEFTISMPVSIKEFKLENGVLTIQLEGK